MVCHFSGLACLLQVVVERLLGWGEGSREVMTPDKAAKVGSEIIKKSA